MRAMSLLVAVLCVSSACDKSEASQEPPLVKPGTAPFILPSRAEGVTRIQEGEGTIQYELGEKYPAGGALADIQKGLEAAGWSPLAEDLWNPGLPSSNTVGWRNFVDGRSIPRFRVYQWVGYWRNKHGDVVMHSIRYRASDPSLGAPAIGTGTGRVEIFTADGLRIAGIKVPG